jgi:hypothetical protein
MALFDVSLIKAQNVVGNSVCRNSPRPFYVNAGEVLSRINAETVDSQCNANPRQSLRGDRLRRHC